ncbi:MAG: rhomboid family intramembrane serine protease [Aureliella sp.]
MRFLAELEGRRKAELFVAHLLTEDIDTHIELAREGSDIWEVWVREEDKLNAAQDELIEFTANSDDSKYEAAMLAARKILQEREQRRADAVKNLQKTDRPAANAMMGGGRMPPLTLTLFIICIVLGFLTEFGRPSGRLGVQIMDRLSFVSAADYDRNDPDRDPAASIKKGEIWRVLTPSVLHGDIIHLAMNMFMFVSFGRLVERWIGTPRFALLVLALVIIPNLFQGLSPEFMRGSPLFVGISGVLYGLFGFVWIRTTLNPGHGIRIPFPMVAMLVGIIVIGLTGLIPGWRLADLCHLGGLLVGTAAGFAAERVFR